MKNKVCIFCKKEYFVHNYRSSSARFCSSKCYNTYRAKLAYPERVCSYCGQKFSVIRNTRARKYCSQECANLTRRKYEHKDKICDYCRKKIEYNSKNPHQQFCSVICQVKSRAYEVDKNFFNKINSESKSYLLGLIFSDGNISSKGYYLNISSIDQDLIKICKNLLKTNRPIYHYKNSFFLIIGNKNLHNSLKKLGVLERKSWKDYSLPSIPKNLRWHFIRGFFDGDGSFYIANRGKYKYLCASFCCGSRKFLEEIRELLEKHNITPHKIRLDKKENGSCWQLTISKKESIKSFVYFLYKNSKYFLNRKYKIVKSFYE